MPYNYEGNPFFGTPPYTGQALIDTVRFLVGDTDSSDWQLLDGEIVGLFANNNSDVYGTAIEACRVLMAKFARQVNKNVGNASIEAADRMEHYKSLRQELQMASMRHGGAPTIYVGGISQADRETDREDDDVVQPAFDVGGMDNPDNAIDLVSGVGFTQVVPG